MDDAIMLDDYTVFKSLVIQKASPEELESLLFKSCNFFAENCAAILLTMGVDKDCVDSNRMTPLMHAAMVGCVEITSLLITWGCQVNTLGGTEGNSALHLAAQIGHLEICKMLIAAGANVNIRNEKDDTPLIIAASEGHLHIVKLLLENHASINRRGHRECSALHRATEYGHYEVCSYLITCKAGLEDEDTFGNTPLICAAEKGHINLVLLYLAQGADVNRFSHSGTTALHYAAKEGWTACCKVLLHHGAEIDAQDIRRFTPLMLAVLERHKKVLQLMLDAKCNVNMVAYNRRTALHYAAERNYADCCRILMDSGAHLESLDGDRCSPAMLAAMKGNLETLKLLISSGAEMNHMTRQGLSILHLAAEGGSIECCKLLIQCGLSINARNFEGVTPLICAIRTTKTPVILYLLSQSCSVQKLQGDAYTALTEAVYRNMDKFVIEKILTQGASPNETDHFNTLPLWYAVDNLNLPVVKLLLMCNCDFLSETESVFAPCVLCSPMTHAVHKASPVLVQWLVSAYAEEGASILRKMNLCNVFHDPDNSEFVSMIHQLVSQPQSLLRQCRRTIRKQMGHGVQVGKKIACLHLPTLLYNYMLFSDLEPNQVFSSY
ncbi:ankyrin repeat domain-containing protein 17 [Biomphalaria glabrata]|nr:ankyrin repeat domain-containing protein 17-like [Biomphalaria glabrata]